jgi:hypothetical protein
VIKLNMNKFWLLHGLAWWNSIRVEQFLPSLVRVLLC